MTGPAWHVLSLVLEEQEARQQQEARAMPDADPEATAAVAAVLRLLSDTRQAILWRSLCVGCQRLPPREPLVSTAPALCRDCQALWERRR
jgi:hypothetical protein